MVPFYGAKWRRREGVLSEIPCERTGVSRAIRMAGSMPGLVDAFDPEDTGDFLDVCEDGFELALVSDF
jgi:hypothetical protein